jgi:hypothetical protein
MDPLLFNIRNASKTAAVIISNDPAVNAVTLVVTNATDSNLRLRAGAPVQEPPPDDGPSSLYLSFGDLVPPTAIAQIKVEADGWQVNYLTDPVPTFALTPTQDRTFASRSDLNIKISNFPVAGPPRTASIGIDYYGFGALDPSSGIASAVVQYPSRGNKPLVLDRNIVGDPVVFITVDPASPIKNTLVFHFSNPSPTDPLVGKDTPWGPNPPEFLVSFVPGKAPGYGALTTLERMKDIQIGLAQVYQDRWEVRKDSGGPKPLWRVKPKAREILGTGEAATVEFRITDLVTELKAGLSLLYVQYANIPGYDDGYFAFQIEKRMPQPGILQFISLTPALIKRGDPITLAWQTFDVSSLTLSYAIDDKAYPRSAPGDVPFNGSYSPVPAATRTLAYTLEAFDYNSNKVQSQVTITVLQPSPVITSLVAAPRIANLADGGKVTLYWRLTNTDNARQLTLTSLDQSGKEITETVDLFLTQKEVTVYKSGGVPFRLRVDGLSDPNYRNEISFTVPTWEDVLTLSTPPAGTVMAFSGQPDKLDSMPGWLKCDGRNVSRNSYPTLWDAIGAIYGGDGNPNFALPDLRGMFLRGVDEGVGRDPDAAGRMTQKIATRHVPAGGNWWLPIQAHDEQYYPTVGATLGSWQDDLLKNHQHNWGHFFYWRNKDGDNLGVHQPPDSRNLQGNKRWATNIDGGGSETRPANVYVYYMIATGQ